MPPFLNMTLRELHRKWDKINFNDLAIDVLLDLDVFIADLNRSQMAKKGVRGDGSVITPDYTFNTKNIKSTKSGISAITEHVTLFDTGDFHKSIIAGMFGNELVLDATDSKTSELIEKYGEVLGLTDESLNILIAKFAPIYMDRINKLLA